MLVFLEVRKATVPVPDLTGSGSQPSPRTRHGQRASTLKTKWPLPALCATAADAGGPDLGPGPVPCPGDVQPTQDSKALVQG